MLRFLILLCFFALSAACGEKERIDRIHMPGTRENVCAAASSEEMKRRGISYQEQVNSKTDFWIYTTQFSFDKKLSLVMPLMYLYEAQIEKNQPATVVPGIDIGFRQPMYEFMMAHPDTIRTEVSKNAYISVAIACHPDFLPGNYKPSETLGMSSDEVVENKLSQTIEYHSQTSVNFRGVGAGGTNPDGSTTMVWCDKTMMKDCRSTFLLAPGVLVTYKYPLEQKEDWARIKDFIVKLFNDAIRER